jgi:antitoxin component of MazEF toxin-antitoxin module
MQVSRIGRHGNAHGITIPRAYLRELRWGAGDYVALEIVQDRLQISLVRPPGILTRIAAAAMEAVHAEGQG